MQVWTVWVGEIQIEIMQTETTQIKMMHMETIQMWTIQVEMIQMERMDDTNNMNKCRATPAVSLNCSCSSNVTAGMTGASVGDMANEET